MRLRTSISWEFKVLSKLEEVRGDIPLSTYINNHFKKYFKLDKKTTKKL